MPDLTIDTERTHAILTGFLRAEFQRAGFERAVVGVSGGVDSALSCFLAAGALGAQNVLAVRMPYRTSSPASLEHAQMVIEAAGVQSLTIEITPMVEPLFSRFPEMNSLRRGNIMSRQRMIILYDQSSATNALVVGTGNKTEILLGYTTLFGDSACALNPLGDLYKTQALQLARAMGIPEIIVANPPSADLWEGQTDEGELGFSYARVDRLLYLLVDEGCTPAACVSAGFEQAFVHLVMDRVRRSQFKRSLPPIARLSERTTAYDFTPPSSWGG
ncbi:MAG: NAD+ synthase [Anaerolineaceae bacterium]|nr:NAD+ synthase [Anaerolineaceae bacterium]